MTENATSILLENDFKNNNLREKVHIVIGMIENLCHEIVYHKHDKMNYDAMTESVIPIISYLLK